jgi:hypothetical protein
MGNFPGTNFRWRREPRRTSTTGRAQDTQPVLKSRFHYSQVKGGQKPREGETRTNTSAIYFGQSLGYEYEWATSRHIQDSIVLYSILRATLTVPDEALYSTVLDWRYST